LLALVLAKYGVHFRIIEKARFHRHLIDNFACPQPRTLEIWNLLGVLPDLEVYGIPVPTVLTYKPGELEHFKSVKFVQHVDPTPSIPYVIPCLQLHGINISFRLLL